MEIQELKNSQSSTQVSGVTVTDKQLDALGGKNTPNSVVDSCASQGSLLDEQPIKKTDAHYNDKVSKSSIWQRIQPKRKDDIIDTDDQKLGATEISQANATRRR